MTAGGTVGESRLYTVLRLGPGVTAAERQASAIYAGGGLLAVLVAGWYPEHARDLIPLGLACLLLAAIAWWLPWRRWPSQTTLLLALPAFALLAWSAVALEPVQAILGPFFVLVFVWAGLHHRPPGVLALVPLAVTAYAIPLVINEEPASMVVLWSLLLALVMALVGLVIADRVDRLENTKGRLAQAEQWRAAVMLTLAHDVRAPLTAVQATLEMLDEPEPALPPADRHRLARLALRQAARIRRLAAGLIDLERIEGGQIRLDLREVQVRAALAESLEHAGVRDARVRVVPEALRVRADPLRLEQVLVNLLGNARKYGEPPVLVDAEPADGMVQITVRDHGPGLPPGGGARLFQRFSRDQRDPESVGLGLWAARQLVRAHGGELEYQPAAPGARFVIHLPASGPAPTPAPDGPG